MSTFSMFEEIDCHETDVERLANKILRGIKKLQTHSGPKLADHIKELSDLIKELISKSNKETAADLQPVIDTAKFLYQVVISIVEPVRMKVVELLGKQDTTVDELSPFNDVIGTVGETVENFLHRPFFISIEGCKKFLRHIGKLWENHWGKITVGGVVGGCVGAGLVLALASNPGGWIIAIAAAAGLLISGGVVAIGCAIHESNKETPEQVERRKSIEFLKRYRNNGFTKSDAEELTKVLNEHILRPFGQVAVAEKECPICKEDLKMCPHAGATTPTHHDYCCVLPFQCRHVLCHKCAVKPTLHQCPQCETTQRRV